MNKLKDMVQPPKKVKFSYYRDQSLWYETECGFLFPVPISDIGNATFLSEDKAMLYMRYIRKHLKALEQKELDKSGTVLAYANNYPETKG